MQVQRGSAGGQATHVKTPVEQREADGDGPVHRTGAYRLKLDHQVVQRRCADCGRPVPEKVQQGEDTSTDVADQLRVPDEVTNHSGHHEDPGDLQALL
jgi:hypothetical protein